MTTRNHQTYSEQRMVDWIHNSAWVDQLERQAMQGDPPVMTATRMFQLL